MQQILRRSFFALILTLGLLWIFASADRSGASTGGHIPAPQKGFYAPEFRLNTLNGTSVALTDFHGKVVLLNLWATWCPPCQQEMPTIEKLYEEYKDQGFVVLGVNATSQDNLPDLPPFIEKNKISFPVLLDSNNEVSSLYLLRSLPTSFFIGRDGVIKEVVVGGPMSEALIRADIEEIIQ